MKQLKIADRYTIKELIHESNMSLVYLAFDENLKREVIIKKIKAEKPTLEMKNRFKREIEILVELDHSGIVPIYECSYNGEIFYVMKYIKGKSLKELLPNISNESKLVIFRQVLEIISFIHKKKILHRDIKPDNILIDNQGKVFVTDFGISKFLNNIQTKLTSTDKFIGTIQYASPEHFEPRKLCEGSDIYSLGIILYEILTGSPPFKNESDSETMKLHLLSPVPPILSEIKNELKLICYKMLKKEIIERYSDCDEIIKQLTIAQNVLSENKKRIYPIILFFCAIVLCCLIFLFQDKIKMSFENFFKKEIKEISKEESEKSQEIKIDHDEKKDFEIMEKNELNQNKDSVSDIPIYKKPDGLENKETENTNEIKEAQKKSDQSEENPSPNSDTKNNKDYPIEEKMYVKNDKDGYARLRKSSNTKSMLINFIPNGYVAIFKKTGERIKKNKDSEFNYWYYSKELGGYVSGDYLISALDKSDYKGIYLENENSNYKVSKTKTNLLLIRDQIMKKGKIVGNYSINKNKLILRFENKKEITRCFVESGQVQEFLVCR
ncbi:MAG: serine/threonine protein kinase [Leptospiraceae bacterium]|nr:serine/threonine protein kinase [Leptospiraceae bacterium]